MKKVDFYIQLHEFLEVKSVPAFNDSTIIKTLEEFDSMMILTIIAFVDQEFNKTLSADLLNSIQSVEDLRNLIGLENFS
jgi:acyl carrier protein